MLQTPLKIWYCGIPSYCISEVPSEGANLDTSRPRGLPSVRLLSGLWAAAVNIAERFRHDLPGRFEAASLLGRTKPGREQRQAGRWNMCFLQAFPVLQDILRPL